MTHEHIECPDLTKDVVFSSTDEARLNQWHRDLYDLFDDIQSRIEAYQDAGTAEDEWVFRAAGKVAFCKMAIRWIERRLAELGMDLPCTRGGRERQMIQTLRRRIRELEEEVAFLRQAEAA